MQALIATRMRLCLRLRRLRCRSGVCRSRSFSTLPAPWWQWSAAGSWGRFFTPPSQDVRYAVRDGDGQWAL